MFELVVFMATATSKWLQIIIQPNLIGEKNR